MKLKFHKSAQLQVGSMLDHQLDETQERRRLSLLKQLSSMQYLVKD